MMRGAIAVALALAIGGCSKNAVPKDRVPGVPPERGSASRPLRKEAPTIDPKSSEAAEQLVEGFVRLLNAGSFGDAYMLLGPNAPPQSQFDERFKSLSRLHASSGAAGLQEGAAGSIYISVPMTIDGTVHGEQVSRRATAVLRRVNDVPGSSAAERRWHIERIDWEKD